MNLKPQEVLQIFMFERLIERLSVSKYKEKEYELFDETEKVENHYILVYRDAFIYLRTQHTNSTKEIIELFGGKIKLS